MDTSLRSAPSPFRAQERVESIAGAGYAGALPARLTSFVGRGDEIAVATSLLEQPGLRLLTLTGPGGIGKTRLAIEIAAQSGVQFPDGVLFVSLASVHEPTVVMLVIANALGLRESDSADIDDAIAAALGTARILLVVDNFEHVMDAAPTLTGLLSRCPHLKIMVTSRSLLRVEGEHAIPVPPLALPRTNEAMTHDDWLEVPVVRLFIERARAVDPSLAWTPSAILHVVNICERLDGLPLAVELAATRVRHLSLGEINERLDAILPLLIDGSRDHPSRLQTMRNAIAWSYDLLTPETQKLLRQAAVFRGGFSRDAIVDLASVLEDPAVDVDPVPSIEDGLARLIDASLLIREAGPIAGTTRYHMLETIREFAWDEAERHGEQERARQAHAAYFTTYATRHQIAELIPEHVEAMERLVVEQDNLRFALTWSMGSSDGERFERLVAALGRFWLAQSRYQEARTWFERAVAAQSDPLSVDSAKILVMLGMTEIFQEETAAAEPHLTQGGVACWNHGEAHGAALALIGRAGLAVTRGETARSSHLLEEAQQAVEAMTDARLAGVMSGWVSINRAVVARAMLQDETAQRHIEDALDRFKAEQFHVGTIMALGDLGDLAQDRGDWMRALILYKEALASGGADGATRTVIEIIESAGVVAVQSGQLDRGVTLIAAAEGLRDRIGLRYRQPRNRVSLDAAVEVARLGLPAEGFAAEWDAGRALSLHQAIAEVLDVQDTSARSRQFGLTARESEVLRLLATGMTDPDIADALFIGVRTVEHHVASVFRKLDVRTRTAATSTAIAAGLVAADGSA